MQDLKSSIATLDGAIQKADWEAATRALQRASAIDEAVVASRFAEAVVVRGSQTLVRLFICWSSPITLSSLLYTVAFSRRPTSRSPRPRRCRPCVRRF